MKSESQSLPTLLIADDNVDAVKTFKIIARNDFNCLEAFTTDATVAILKQGEIGIDLLLLDLTFHGSSTEVLLQELEQLPNLPPIVILTGKSPEQCMAEKARLRAYTVMQKPAHPDLLIMALKEALTRKRTNVTEAPVSNQ